MGTKQNFKNALNELMAGKLAQEEDAAETITERNTAERSAPEEVIMQKSFTEESAPEVITEAPKVSLDPVINKPASTYTAPDNSLAKSANAKISVLTSDLTIEGNVRCKSDIRLEGHVKGNVFCDGSIACGGVVEGDVFCDSLVLSSCSINGNIIAKSDITIDPDSTIIGDINAHNLVSNGRVKGNIHTSGATTLRDQAMLMGNIEAKSISLDSGASLKGTLTIQTAELSDEDFDIPAIEPFIPYTAPSAAFTPAAPAAPAVTAAPAAPAATVTTTPAAPAVPEPTASIASSTAAKATRRPSFPVFQETSFPDAGKSGDTIK